MALSPSTHNNYQEALVHLRTRVTEATLLLWADTGLQIASVTGLTSDTVVNTYYRVSAQVQPHLAPIQFERWFKLVLKVATKSAELGLRFLDNSGVMLEKISPRFLEDWAVAGLDLVARDGRDTSLAALFFDTTPILTTIGGYRSVSRFAEVLTEVSRSDRSGAHKLVQDATRIFSQMGDDIEDYLDLFVEPSLKNVDQLCSELATTLEQITREAYTRVIALIAKLKSSLIPLEEILESVKLGSNMERHTSESQILQLWSMVNQLADVSPTAALEFWKRTAELLPKLGMSHIQVWYEEGIQMNDAATLELYFKGESKTSQKLLSSLQDAVLLTEEIDVLELYCGTLLNTPPDIRELGDLELPGIDIFQPRYAFSEGRNIYLPKLTMECADYKLNFALLKVMATHQASYIRWGSFKFNMAHSCQLLRDLRSGIIRELNLPTPDPQEAMAYFLRLFKLPDLARRIFALIENVRIEHIVGHTYRGIKEDYDLARSISLQTRSQPIGLSRQATVLEALTRVMLGQHNQLALYEKDIELFETLLSLINTVRTKNADIGLTAELTTRVYLELFDLTDEIKLGIGEYSIDMKTVPPYKEMDEEYERYLAKLVQQVPGEKDAENQVTPSNDVSMSEQSQLPQTASYWGDYEPELVQGLFGISEDSMDDDLDASETRVTNLDTENDINELVSEPSQSESAEMDDNPRQYEEELPTTTSTQSPRDSLYDSQSSNLGSDVYLYDEWDRNIGTYRRGWCAVYEKHPDARDPNFLKATMDEYGDLARRIRAKFESIAPETQRRQTRLADGDEIDLDSAVEALLDMRSGAMVEPRIYTRNGLKDRSSAVAFLFDISASTAEIVDRTNNPQSGSGKSTAKRILDFEKQSITLLSAALDYLGDTYGVYAFSGYGRDNVEFYTFKEFNEKADIMEVAARIGALKPHHATRMGAAIRHTTSKLMECDARVKFLFLLSDGRPQDKEYSREEGDKAYAVDDTRLALMEARKGGITPFCLTVDRQGNEYMGDMMAGINYEILYDIRTLPARLAHLYNAALRNVN